MENGSTVLYPPLHPSCVENPCYSACQRGLEQQPNSWQQKWINLCEKDTRVKWDWSHLLVPGDPQHDMAQVSYALSAARKKPWHELKDVVRPKSKCLCSPCVLPPKCLLWEMEGKASCFILIRKLFVKQDDIQVDFKQLQRWLQYPPDVLSCILKIMLISQSIKKGMKYSFKRGRWLGTDLSC